MRKCFPFIVLCFGKGYLLAFPAFSSAQEAGGVFTLKQTIKSALKTNIEAGILTAQPV